MPSVESLPAVADVPDGVPVSKKKKSSKSKGDAGANAPDEAPDAAATEEVTERSKADKRERKERKEKKKRERLAAYTEIGKEARAKEKEKKRKEEEHKIQAGDAPALETKEERKRRKQEKKEKKRKRLEAEDDNPATDNGVSSAPPREPEEKPSKKQKSRHEKNSNGHVQPTATPAAGPYGYQQAPALTELPQSKVDAFLQSQSVTVTDATGKMSHLRPIIEFAHLPSTPLLEKKPFGAFKEPTPIQAASWPFTLSGRDVVGVAETGSGKTMAFALPCVYKVLQAKHGGIKAAIVAPTRELAMQTHEQVSQLADLVGVRCICIYGGASKDEQRRLLAKGPDIVVATPGRLKDFMAEGCCDLGRVQFAVLDEADRMLDKGFEDDIKQILSSTAARGERQTLMFTATWPRSVQALASTMMLDAVRITIGSAGAKEDADGPATLQANVRISQAVEVMESHDKEARLLRVIQQQQRSASKGDLHRILVFCLYKKEAARVETFLNSRGIRVGGIHGDMNQSNRTAALAAFKSGSVPVLVATDVAARGLDIPEVKLVINCTFPLTIEDYVHRIGRTGRAGKTGEALTFFTKQDKALSGALVNVLKASNQPVPEDLLKFGTTVKKKAHPIYGAFYREPAAEPSDVPAKITFDD